MQHHVQGQDDSGGGVRQAGNEPDEQQLPHLRVLQQAAVGTKSQGTLLFVKLAAEKPTGQQSRTL